MDPEWTLNGSEWTLNGFVGIISMGSKAAVEEYVADTIDAVKVREDTSDGRTAVVMLVVEVDAARGTAVSFISSSSGVGKSA